MCSGAFGVTSVGAARYARGGRAIESVAVLESKEVRLKTAGRLENEELWLKSAGILRCDEVNLKPLGRNEIN